MKETRQFAESSIDEATTTHNIVVFNELDAIISELRNLVTASRICNESGYDIPTAVLIDKATQICEFSEHNIIQHHTNTNGSIR
jgi:hypothetical protein